MGELMCREGSGVRKHKSGNGVIVIYTCTWCRLSSVSVNSIMGRETLQMVIRSKTERCYSKFGTAVPYLEMN